MNIRKYGIGLLMYACTASVCVASSANMEDEKHSDEECFLSRTLESRIGDSQSKQNPLLHSMSAESNIMFNTSDIGLKKDSEDVQKSVQINSEAVPEKKKLGFYDTISELGNTVEKMQAPLMSLNALLVSFNQLLEKDINFPEACGETVSKTLEKVLANKNLHLEIPVKRSVFLIDYAEKASNRLHTTLKKTVQEAKQDIDSLKYEFAAWEREREVFGAKCLLSALSGGIFMILGHHIMKTVPQNPQSRVKWGSALMSTWFLSTLGIFKMPLGKWLYSHHAIPNHEFSLSHASYKNNGLCPKKMRRRASFSLKRE